MIARGVPREAISAVGYGPSKPLADNATEASRAANRSTTVRWAQRRARLSAQDMKQASRLKACIDYDGDGILEGENEGSKPATLDGARGGVADDLKQIKGIGPKMEKMCNALGFYHFDQIAAWTPDEEAWVNANLEGFKGRVSRDAMDQCKPSCLQRVVRRSSRSAPRAATFTKTLLCGRPLAEHTHSRSRLCGTPQTRPFVHLLHPFDALHATH